MLRSGNIRIRIISRLSPVWRVIGDLLEFDDCGAKLVDIEQNYPNDRDSCCRDILQLWLMGEGVRPCTWRKLIQIIEDSDQEMLVKEIKAVLPHDMKAERERLVVL